MKKIDTVEKQRELSVHRSVCERIAKLYSTSKRVKSIVDDFLKGE